MGRRIAYERPQQIPFDKLHYELRPDLVSRLTWAHGNAGRVAAMRFSHFGLKRLQADAGKRRIAYLVMRAGYSAVKLDDVVHVIAQRMAADAVIDHELRAGGIDSHGLLVLADSDPGAQALRLDNIIVGRADADGDLTSFFEHFSMEIARALGELHRRLESFQDREDRLPWLVVRPPDELDRAIFEVIERLCAARSSQIIDALHEPPPLRTLQRRLQRLCREGLLAKHGGRRDAFYQCGVGGVGNRHARLLPRGNSQHSVRQRAACGQGGAQQRASMRCRMAGMWATATRKPLPRRGTRPRWPGGSTTGGIPRLPEGRRARRAVVPSEPGGSRTRCSS